MSLLKKSTLGSNDNRRGTISKKAPHSNFRKQPKEEAKTEQAAPGAPVVINLQNNNTNQQKQSSGGTNTVIKERVIEKPAAAQPAPASKPEPKEEDPW